jgi:nitrite reductase (NADH) large subunit
MGKKELIIVGNGMATSRLLDVLTTHNAQRLFNITVFGEETGGCYNRILLNKVLTGEDTDGIVMKSPEWYSDKEVHYLDATRVTQLDTAGRFAQTSSGDQYRYDVAVFATGSAPFVPPIEGLHRGERWKDHVFAYRTLDDCLQIRSRVNPGNTAVVLGGGLLGIEAAKALSDTGAHVTVVHLAPTLMETQLDPHGGEILRRRIEGCGIFVRTGTTIQKVLGDKKVECVVLDDGTTLASDLLVLACGIRPRVDVAIHSGVPVNRGILVNDALATSVPGVYAIGECAEHSGRLYGLVAPVWEQATVLGEMLSGHKPQARYRGSKLYTNLKVAGVEVASMGVLQPEVDEDEIIQVIEDRKQNYRKLIVRDGKLLGAMLVGNAHSAAALVQLYDRDEGLPANRLDVLCSLSASSPFSRSLSQKVCACNGVSEEQIIQAISEGACSVDEIAKCTRATTGCGSCRGQVTRILSRYVTELRLDPTVVDASV